MVHEEKKATGAVLLLGSLYWEGNEALWDGEKGELRKKWRADHLQVQTCKDVSIPITYGRRSTSRKGEFTMVLGGGKDGVAKMATLTKSLPADANGLDPDAEKILADEVRALATAEGIWTETNRKHYCSWALVSIAVNPKSQFKEALRDLWKKSFRPQTPFAAADYGKGVVDQDGFLEISLPEANWTGLDFCLATPTKPDRSIPSAKAIAEAIMLASYFFRTNASGITTPDDEQIKAEISEMNSKH
jgi:hypothetical protein